MKARDFHNNFNSSSDTLEKLRKLVFEVKKKGIKIDENMYIDFDNLYKDIFNFLHRSLDSPEFFKEAIEVLFILFKYSIGTNEFCQLIQFLKKLRDEDLKIFFANFFQFLSDMKEKDSFYNYIHNTNPLPLFFPFFLKIQKSDCLKEFIFVFRQLSFLFYKIMDTEFCLCLCDLIKESTIRLHLTELSPIRTFLTQFSGDNKFRQIETIFYSHLISDFEYLQSIIQDGISFTEVFTQLFFDPIKKRSEFFVTSIPFHVLAIQLINSGLQENEIENFFLKIYDIYFQNGIHSKLFRFLFIYPTSINSKFHQMWFKMIETSLIQFNLINIQEKTYIKLFPFLLSTITATCFIHQFVLCLYFFVQCNARTSFIRKFNRTILLFLFLMIMVISYLTSF